MSLDLKFLMCVVLFFIEVSKCILFCYALLREIVILYGFQRHIFIFNINMTSLLWH